MLKALPREYSYIGDIIDLVPETERTVEYLKSKIKLKAIENKNSSSYEDENAKSNVFTAQSTKTENRSCYNCGQIGHLQGDCKKANNNTSRGNSNVTRGKRGSWRGYNQSNRGYFNSYRGKFRGRGRGQRNLGRNNNTSGNNNAGNCSNIFVAGVVNGILLSCLTVDVPNI
ncbi:PREDICTED: bromodomain-containing protein DDB_G0270170-like [Rhagoletis zephyria]|uniref:bromodomain-containing protein DDB_G0270170-like n=1 Tax=Rhagoletis zephyria TaxID=28612 RepID=UPI0008115849|nr:PREDICTED: bromodomain-containing protein DDB_G0270170-like [Rhagoletis zephyria]